MRHEYYSIVTEVAAEIQRQYEALIQVLHKPQNLLYRSPHYDLRLDAIVEVGN